MPFYIKIELLIFLIILSVSCKSDDSSIDSGQKVDTSLLFDYESAPFQKLSDYKLFEGNMSDFKPVSQILPYELTSELFTDYAKKSRFIYIPSGRKINYTGDFSVLDFPEGTTLIKNFFYYIDERNPSLGKKIIETRLLIKKSSGWKAIEYTWNNEQTEAYRNASGGELSVNTILKDGTTISVPRYQIPQEVQCVSCHKNNGIFIPIGPKPASLNKEMMYSDGASVNQLQKWMSMGWFNNFPGNVSKMPDYNDASIDLNSRARAYLDINCAHCHMVGGDAQANGVLWNYDNQDLTKIGINKKPSNFDPPNGYTYNIVKKDPSHSVVLYRMLVELTNNDQQFGSSVMPRLGRTIQHKEGIKLIEEWINTMN